MQVNSSSINSSTTNISSGTTMNLSSSTISSGMINNSGQINITSSSNMYNSNLNNTSTGRIDVYNGQALTLNSGTYTNDGTIALNAYSSSSSSLYFSGTVTLQGTGKVLMNDHPYNYVYGGTLIQESGHTIQGAGGLGLNSMNITNRGIIHANLSNQLIIDPSSSLNNQGTLKATGVGRMVLEAATYTNTGTIEAKDGGTITLNSGANLTTSGTVHVGSSSKIMVNGTYTQTGGQTRLSALNSILETTGNFALNDGSVCGIGTIKTLQFVNSGIVNPGDNGIGRLVITGDYQQLSDAVLNIEIASASSYDQLWISGAANLGGTLNISLLGDYHPYIGTSFTIMSFASKTNNFSNITLSNVPDNLFGLVWQGSSLMLVSNDYPDPVLSASNTNFGNVRIGTNATATVTVTNTGDPMTNLTGSIGAASGSELSPASGAQTFSLGQNQSATRTYTYTPETRGSDSTVISITSNAGDTTRTLTGTGVSPVYSSSVAPGSIIDMGSVEAFSSSQYILRIQNITPDSDLGNLTNLALLSAVISGADASYFSLENFTPGTVLSKNAYFDLVISITHPEWRFIFRNAVLTIYTDQGAAFGASGQSFTYSIKALCLPEPSSILMMCFIILGITIQNKKIFKFARDFNRK